MTIPPPRASRDIELDPNFPPEAKVYRFKSPTEETVTLPLREVLALHRRVGELEGAALVAATVLGASSEEHARLDIAAKLRDIAE